MDENIDTHFGIVLTPEEGRKDMPLETGGNSATSILFVSLEKLKSVYGTFLTFATSG